MKHDCVDLFAYFRDELIDAARRRADTYRSAHPYPHIVWDDFLPIDVAEAILERFPVADHPSFRQPDLEPFQVNKLGRVQDSGFRDIDPWLRSTLFEFNSMAFVDSLEALTGIKGLIADPHFSGGAFHNILPGGKLAVHADFNIDTRRQLRRRLNVLIYLNKDWLDAYNGHLEIWDEHMKERVKSVAPIFNRAVIFNTDSTSYHGHPVPLATPEGRTRKSIALYYYTADKDAFNVEIRHSTLWQQPRVD